MARAAVWAALLLLWTAVAGAKTIIVAPPPPLVLPKLPPAVVSAPTAKKAWVDAWGQCGGKASCVTTPGAICKDAVWPGMQCIQRHNCVRNNEWFYNCMPDTAPAPPPGVAPLAPESAPAPYAPFPSPPNPKAAPPPPLPPRAPLTEIAEAGMPKQPMIFNRKTPAGDYDYTIPLKMSNWFYRAQRSGKLPPTNGVFWRRDSQLKANYNGKDVSGGWYDAGDNVKFNFPMAFTSTVLSWSVLEFEKGYTKSGELNAVLDNIKWANDYFLRCIIDKSTIVGQVGNGQQDHSLWIRPEDSPVSPPVYVLTPQKPGSDLAGAMAASLAVASVVWQKRDAAYSAKLLAGARTLYQFGKNYIGTYSKSIPDAGNFYPSTSKYDDLCLAALWLYMRTGDKGCLTDAIRFYDLHWTQEGGSGVWNNFDWDNNSWACVALLAKLNPTNPWYKQRMQAFIQDWGGKGPYVRYTPKGLGVSSDWGSLRHNANAMFFLRTYANVINDTRLANVFECWAHKQLNYILGGTGRGFVVGYGYNGPRQAHHRAASCPNFGTPCNYNNGFNPDRPNPHVIYGALVGGPDRQDYYLDKRSNYQQNEVAVDYNSGFMGILAAMVASGRSSAQCP